MLFITRPVHEIGSDSQALHRVCKRIAERRIAEANTLPALEQDSPEFTQQKRRVAGLNRLGLAFIVLLHAAFVALGFFIAR